jgi:hypothetical protein
MWDNYYDKVEYLEKTDSLDKFGNIVYKPSRTIDVRYIAGGEKYIIGKEETSTKYTKEYHIPFMVNEGDKIDGKLVVTVEPSRDVFGNFHFCIVKVE